MTQTVVTDVRSDILAPGSPTEFARIKQILSRETVGGGLLILAAGLALILANTGAVQWYQHLRKTHLGVHLGTWSFELSLAHWASDGLLTLFFFLAGLELKREFVAGDLRRPAQALVPVAAAVGGVLTPAALYVVMTMGSRPDVSGGWAIPVATDIAFALAVLAVVGRNLPGALRTFLLTLAIVDDLIAITIIALFYTSEVHLGYLAAALLPLAAFGIIVNRRQGMFLASQQTFHFVLGPLAVLTWALLLHSGIHATIAGVLLAFTIPVRSDDGPHGLAEVLEHRFRPWSSAVAVPLFAFFSAGVPLRFDALGSQLGLGILMGLIGGKALGITGATWLVTRLRGAQLDRSIGWIDVAGIGVLAGMGFTVSLLVSELSFTTPDLMDTAKASVLVASLVAGAVGGAILAARGRHHAALADQGA